LGYAAGAEESAAPAPARKHDPARPFIHALSSIAPTTTVILWERGTVLKSNSLLKALAKTGTVETYDAPKAGEIEDWIFARARSKGARLKPDVPRLLAEHLGSDLEVLDEELNKLSLFAGAGEMVDTAMVRLLTPQTRQADTLQLLNAASDRRTAEALSLLHELLDDGVAPVAVIGMLGSQVRKLLQVQALAARRLPAAEIAQRLAMHPYATRMAVESLRHHTPGGLRDLHSRLVQTDQAIKTGQADGTAALELLVLDMARGGR
jgi:DNA polymerase-3 subunit delta